MLHIELCDDPARRLDRFLAAGYSFRVRWAHPCRLNVNAIHLAFPADYKLALPESSDVFTIGLCRVGRNVLEGSLDLARIPLHTEQPYRDLAQQNRRNSGQVLRIAP